MTNEKQNAEAYGTPGAIYPPYPTYKPSGVAWIGDIPEGWEVRRLKIICRFQYGKSLSDNQRNAGEVSVYGSNGIVGYHDFSITKQPCLIIGRKGSFGKVNFSSNKCFPIDTTFFVDANSTKNDIKWLYYALSDLKLDEDNQDSAVPGLNREKAYSRVMLLPSLPEQRAIAAFLDRETARLNAIIAKQTQMLALLREKRAALITQAVTRGLAGLASVSDAEFAQWARPVNYKSSGVEWIGEIPEGWEVRRLKTICRFQYGKSLSDNQRNAGEVPVYGSNGIVDYHDFSITKQPCLIIGRKGSFGKVNFSSNKCFPIDTTFFVDANSTKNDIKWLYYALSDLKLDEDNQDSAVPGLNREKAYSKIMLLPPLPEQQAIAAFLNRETARIDAMAAKIDAQLALLHEYKHSLITHAVTGKFATTEGTEGTEKTEES